MVLCKLIQGDCLKVMPTIPNDSIDFILTDPPYNVGLEYNSIDDKMSDDEYYKWCLSWLKEINRVLKQGHYAVVFTGDTKCYWMFKAVMESGLTYHHFFKWYKVTGLSNLSGTVVFGRGELAFALSKGKPDNKVVNHKKVWQDVLIHKTVSAGDRDAVNHNARRPVPLYQQLIEGFTKDGETVMDIFTGSGTTMIAASNSNRNCICIEIDSKYCDIIKDRCFGRQFLDRECTYSFEKIGD